MSAYIDSITLTCETCDASKELNILFCIVYSIHNNEMLELIREHADDWKVTDEYDCYCPEHKNNA